MYSWSRSKASRHDGKWCRVPLLAMLREEDSTLRKEDTLGSDASACGIYPTTWIVIFQSIASRLCALSMADK